MKTFAMQSNRGWNSTSFKIHGKGRTDEDIVLTIDVLSKFWDRSVEIASSNVIVDSSFRLEQVICKRENLRRLSNHLNKWLENHAQFLIELTDSSEQSLLVSLGPDTEMISSSDKPLFSCHYSATPSLEIKWKYIVDETCIRSLSEDLNKEIYQNY